MNNFCKAIGIRYPIILGGMARVGTAPLAAAVSDAGGLGLLGSSAWSASELKSQIRRTRELTDKKFGVNMPVHAKHTDELAETIFEEKISVVSTSAGDPRIFTSRFKEKGIFVLHVVPTVDFAIKAYEAGVSAVIAEGSESGGMTGQDEISTLVLVPLIVDAVTCPVIAAGGIGDGRGLVAALSLGAVGVQMGTVFLSAEECEVSRAFKEILIMAKETDTSLVRGDKRSRRILSEAFFNEAKKIIEKNNPGIFQSIESSPDAGTRGSGQIVGLIHRIRPAADIIQEIIKDANNLLPGIRKNLPGE